MCGIGGFSLTSKSRVNVRKLSNALLTGLERRGNQASGFAWQSSDASGFFKAATAGSKLSLKALPKDAQSVILHTRMATHGSIQDNRNNHPVMSPDQSIALVHNGVIYNHDVVRNSLDFKLPEVDTAVIPALIQAHNGDTDKFEMLDGDAAIAWLDSNDTGTLRVARVSHSPLFIAQDVDGSFFFASTEDILRNALKTAGVTPVFVSIVNERTLMEVRAGRVDSFTALPELSPEFAVKFSYKDSYRSVTSGKSQYVSAFGQVENAYGMDPYGLEADFEAWLDSYHFYDGLYYDRYGTFVGTRESLREEFEEWGFDSWFRE